MRKTYAIILAIALIVWAVTLALGFALAVNG